MDGISANDLLYLLNSVIYIYVLCIYIFIYIYLYIFIYIYIYISHVKPSHGVILKGNHTTNHQPPFRTDVSAIAFFKITFLHVNAFS